MRRATAEIASPAFPPMASENKARMDTFRPRRLLAVFTVTVFFIAIMNLKWNSESNDGTTIAATANNQIGIGLSRSMATPALLVAIPEGREGDTALLVWSDFVLSSRGETLPGENPSDVADAAGFPPVWILSSDANRDKEIRRGMPHLESFHFAGSKPGSSTGVAWSDVLDTFVSENEGVDVIGLFGEGALPSPGLTAGLIDSVLWPALAKTEVPTAILSRSQGWHGGADGDQTREGEGEWHSDKLVVQAWCNRAMLATASRPSAGLQQASVRDLTMLQVIRRLVGASGESGSTLVNGTKLVRATFAGSRDTAPNGEEGPPRGAGESKEGLDPSAFEPRKGEKLYIGELERTLAFESGDEGAKIVQSVWPPSYLMDNAASKRDGGWVLTTNTNCGYLDMAMNFLLSVRRISDEKVFFVAMDRQAFDFLDDQEPGCVALYPQSDVDQKSVEKNEKPGAWGDATFKAEVLVRPDILLAILRQGYRVVWTDVDIVWMGNPMTLLPDLSNSTAAEFLVQSDAKTHSECTCFMILDASPNIVELMEKWKENIVATEAIQNQAAFQDPVEDMVKKGLRMEFIPEKIFPSGNDFFNTTHMEDNPYRYIGNILIVHNNWVVGHENKVKRFVDLDLWHVGNTQLPVCS